MFKKILFIFLFFYGINISYAQSDPSINPVGLNFSDPTNIETDYSTLFFGDISNYSEYAPNSRILLLEEPDGSTKVIDYTETLKMQNIILYNIFLIIFFVCLFHIAFLFYPIINDFIGKN